MLRGNTARISSMATANLDNDFTGVSEKYAHRRVFDETIDLTFYCDAKEYLPIRFLNHGCHI